MPSLLKRVPSTGGFFPSDKGNYNFHLLLMQKPEPVSSMAPFLPSLPQIVPPVAAGPALTISRAVV
jgi:hypothetical protein